MNTAAPVISGSAQQGDTLSASNGSWSNSPSSYLYQWQDCSSSTSCASISGATSSTYTLASSDVGKTVDVGRHRAQCRRCRFGDLGPDGHRAGRVDARAGEYGGAGDQRHARSRGTR